MEVNTYWQDLLATLIGGKIVRVLVDDADSYPDEPLLGMVIKMPNGDQKAIWLLLDEEGNGAGRFDIIEADETKIDLSFD